jgi:hypothetical protein
LSAYRFDVLVHRYKGDKQPVNLINSASNEMVAKGARDDYYAELLKLFLVSDTQIVAICAKSFCNFSSLFTFA